MQKYVPNARFSWKSLLPKEEEIAFSQLLTKASNLFSAVTNGKFVSSATAAAIFTSNLRDRHKMTTVSITKSGSQQLLILEDGRHDITTNVKKHKYSMMTVRIYNEC